MFNRFGDRTVAASIDITLEPYETGWVCEGYQCSFWDELEEDPVVADREFPIEARFNWVTCAPEDYCRASYPPR